MSKYVPPGARQTPRGASQQSRWAPVVVDAPATLQPTAGRAPPAPTPARGGYSARGRGQDGPIIGGGFRQARGEVGRKPGEMEMLASPSRGLDTDDDAASLKNFDVQTRFRAHIAAKLVKFHANFPERTAAGVPIPSTPKRREELSIILLDFRKLREGLTSIRRVDAFTVEVYESSVRYSIAAENWAQLAACLPHLVFHIHPTLRSPPLTGPAADLSVALSTLSLTPPPTLPPAQLLFLGLYLTYLTTHLSEPASFHPVLATLLPSSPSPLPTPLALAHAIYAAVLTSNYLALSRILAPILAPPLTLTGSRWDESESSADERLQLAIVVGALPKLREQVWRSLERSYKSFTDLSWLARVLLFPPGNDGEEAVKEFLVAKGK